MREKQWVFRNGCYGWFHYASGNFGYYLAATLCERSDQGTARKLVRLALDEKSKVAPLVSMPIIKEYHEVLTRLGVVAVPMNYLLRYCLGQPWDCGKPSVMEDSPGCEADPSDTMFFLCFSSGYAWGVSQLI